MPKLYRGTLAKFAFNIEANETAGGSDGTVGVNEKPPPEAARAYSADTKKAHDLINIPISDENNPRHLVEYSSNEPLVRERFGNRGYLVEAVIDEGYLSRGSHTEDGFVLYSGVPVTNVVLTRMGAPGKFAHVRAD